MGASRLCGFDGSYKFRKLFLLLFMIGLPYVVFSQVRPSIQDFSSSQQAELAGLIMDYVTPEIIEYHCNYTVLTGDNSTDIHSAYDFLPFHREYIAGIETWLLTQDKGEYVPLPKWDPSTPTPMPFRVVDPDCASASCTSGNGPCSTPTNWTPPAPSDLTNFLPPATCALSNDQPLGTVIAPGSLSDHIELGYHNQVHIQMGGVMRNFRSPAAPIFWLWHAQVDDLWKAWECQCPLSGINPKDLYVKDNDFQMQSVRDVGLEPNLDPGPMWESKDIWVRTTNDGFANRVHQNPEYYTDPGLFNYVYVEVRNRGCEDSDAGTLDVHWAKAGTALSYPTHWNGSLTTSNGQPVGDLIAQIALPPIAAGASQVFEIPWQPVNPANYVNLFDETDPLFWIDEPEPHHFCLLARLQTPSDPITFSNGSDLNAYVRNNNNVAWKNFSVFDLDPNNIVGVPGCEDNVVVGSTILVGDVAGEGGAYDLELDNPQHYRGNAITDEAEVSLTLSPPMWDRWIAGGQVAQNLVVLREDCRQLVVTGTPAQLKNLDFLPHEQNLAKVGVNFLADQLSGQPTFTFRALQRHSSTGALVGGETFTVNVPGRPGFWADAGEDKMVRAGDSTQVNAYDIGEAAVYNWYDMHGELIYSGIDVVLSPELTQHYTLEVIAEADGVKSYDDLEVVVTEAYIESISPNPASGQAVVTYTVGSASSAYLVMSMPYGGSYNYILDTQASEQTIPLAGITPGYYSVILVSDGVAVDNHQLIVH